MHDPNNTRRDDMDDELERYLAGEHPLSARYRDANTEQPPAALGTAVRASAQQAATTRWRRWQPPVAAAAVLVLGLGLWFGLQRESTVQRRTLAEPAAEKAAPVARPDAVTAPALESRSAIADQQRAPRAAGKQLARPNGIAPATVPHAPTAMDTDTWLAHIRQLLESNRRTAAIESLRQFIKAHPDYKLPDDLGGLAAAQGIKPPAR